MPRNNLLEDTPPSMRSGRKSIASRRCSIGGISSHVSKGGTPTTPFLDVPENNDEEERKQRQLSRLQKLQNSGDVVSSPSSADRRKSISALEPKLTGQQLALHYAKCIQLSAENKISVKNAFNLQLIDYMTDMLNRKDSDMNNFQMASCTLDASTKIYAYRVDCVHTDTMRIAGGLGRTQQEKQQEGGDSFDPSQPGNPTGKRRRNKKTATIESNPSNLSLSSLELDFMVDPLFKKISSQFDEGRSGGGLFLNSLCLKDDCCQLLLDSQAVLSDSTDVSFEKKTVSIPHIPDVSNLSICPSFSSFHFNNWKVGDESFLDCEDEREEKEAHQTHAFDINAIPEPLDDPVDDVAEFAAGGFDNEANEVCDEYDSLEGNVGGDSTVMTIGVEGQHYKSLPSMETIHLKEHLATMPLEYSYFDARVMSAWAGPGHWKLKPAFKGKSDSAHSKEDGPSKKKEPFELNYSSFNEKLTAFDKNFSVTKRLTKLSHSTVKQWSESNTTLPFDLHFDPNDFAKLYGRSDVVVRRQHHLKHQTTVETVDDSIHDYGDDGNQNSGADLDPSEECDTSGHDVTRAFSQTMLPPPSQTEADQFLGDNLVAAPTKVAKINIGYARTAKRMDMKKLKGTVWNMLTQTSKKDKENDLNGANHQGKADEEKNEMNRNTTLQFSAIFKDLPKNLSTNMAENLSFPLAFIALLHLCNEKSLELKPIGQMEDFNIMQG